MSWFPRSDADVRLELDRVRDSLEGEHTNLLTAIDRSKSEADFRAAISVPLLRNEFARCSMA